ncbi:lipoprotein insertase outer membrane protein LolB [Isoalcanivorax beigongshangi]|uniref:Outer-membrane lipoprotein LolB n=1 Tax=Isoalcanivorax beigongshangi TaxID=3238810 RepID=A0ABV4AEX1_9GAMM
MTVRWAAMIITVATLFSGCASWRTVEVPEHLNAATLQHWDLSGRLGYRTAADGGSASLEWRQRSEGGQILFSGPLGFGSAELLWNGEGAELRHGKQRHQAPTPGALAWMLTGMDLPVDALYYWVRGLPFPGAPAQLQRADDGSVTGLQQLGWTLRFDRPEAVGHLVLPHRVRAERGSDRFTLLIHRWVPLS